MNKPNQGEDIILRVHGEIIAALLHPSSPDGNALRLAFGPRVLFRLKDGIAAEERERRIPEESDKVAQYFDAAGGYTTTSWDSSRDSGEKAAEQTVEALTTIRKMIGDKKQIICTFWVANQPEERKPGPAEYPTADQIRMICEAAFRLGIRHLDMYGCRIGDYVIRREDMAQRVPPAPAPYKLTDQFSQKFLWDRPQIHEELAEYLRSLNPK